MKFSGRSLTILALLAGLSLAGAGILYAQLEGADRGVPPIDSASTLEVTGVQVDVVGKNADEARYEAWRRAQGLAWKALWAKSTKQPQSQAPTLSDSVLNSIVSGIIIEEEQIGPRRYIAKLGVLFDRARTGELLGGGEGQVRRSAPMLVIPVMVTGGTPYSFEFRNEWQRAWARFRTGNSPIDYVRPVGSGVDPLLLNLAQTRRPGRGWWRMLLDQYGAADVVVPEVQLKRLYPGGPVIGTFTARFGPDDKLLDRIVLRVESSNLLPRLLDEGVRRLDVVYARALATGMLRPDPSLIVEEPEVAGELAEQIEARNLSPQDPGDPVPVGVAVPYSIQVDTPDSASVSRAELAVSRVRGVTSALTTSLALGGTSVMRVTFVGDINSLAQALQAQGWTVQVTGNGLRMSRGSGGD